MITALWIVFIIWVVFTLICVFMVEVAEEEIYGFLFLISLPVIFYLPFVFMQCCVRKNRLRSVFSYNFFFVRITYEIKFEIFTKFCYNFFRK